MMDKVIKKQGVSGMDKLDIKYKIKVPRFHRE